ncbi:MAG: hypothetical protein JW973_15960 [Bacteroidales bacterium]|nr:hypothetical protein [Bacteroidales bacterium]
MTSIVMMQQQPMKNAWIAYTKNTEVVVMVILFMNTGNAGAIDALTKKARVVKDS